MSTQIEIKKNIIKYLSEFGFKKDALIEKLITETQKLGRIVKMQISAEQAKFLELTTKLISAKKMFRSWSIYRPKQLVYCKGLA